MTVDIQLLDPEIKAYFEECDARRGQPADPEYEDRVTEMISRKVPLRWSHHNLRLGRWVSDQLEARYKAAEARGEDVSNMLPGVWTEAVLIPADSQYLYECALRDLAQMELKIRNAWHKHWREVDPHGIRPANEEIIGEEQTFLRRLLERFLGVLLEAIHHNLDMDFGGM